MFVFIFPFFITVASFDELLSSESTSTTYDPLMYPYPFLYLILYHPFFSIFTISTIVPFDSVPIFELLADASLLTLSVFVFIFPFFITVVSVDELLSSESTSTTYDPLMYPYPFLYLILYHPFFSIFTISTIVPFDNVPIFELLADASLLTLSVFVFIFPFFITVASFDELLSSLLLESTSTTYDPLMYPYPFLYLILYHPFFSIFTISTIVPFDSVPIFELLADASLLTLSVFVFIFPFFITVASFDELLSSLLLESTSTTYDPLMYPYPFLYLILYHPFFSIFTTSTIVPFDSVPIFELLADALLLTLSVFVFIFPFFITVASFDESFKTSIYFPLTYPYPFLYLILYHPLDDIFSISTIVPFFSDPILELLVEASDLTFNELVVTFPFL